MKHNINNATFAIKGRILRENSRSLAEDDTLELEFGNGYYLKLRIGDLNEEILAEATLMGLRKKLTDAAAISRDPATGRSATIETKYQAVLEVYNRLREGQWNKRRESAGGSISLLLEALSRLYPKATLAQLDEVLSQKTKEELAAMKTTPKLAPIIAQIKLERAQARAANGDSDDDLFEGFEELGE